MGRRRQKGTRVDGGERPTSTIHITAERGLRRPRQTLIDPESRQGSSMFEGKGETSRESQSISVARMNLHGRQSMHLKSTSGPDATCPSCDVDYVSVVRATGRHVDVVIMLRCPYIYISIVANAAARFTSCRSCAHRDMFVALISHDSRITIGYRLYPTPPDPRLPTARA